MTPSPYQHLFCAGLRTALLAQARQQAAAQPPAAATDRPAEKAQVVSVGGDIDEDVARPPSLALAAS